MTFLATALLTLILFGGLAYLVWTIGPEYTGAMIFLSFLILLPVWWAQTPAITPPNAPLEIATYLLAGVCSLILLAAFASHSDPQP